jgi:hypothetical protein
VSVSPFQAPNVSIPDEPDPALVKVLYDLEAVRGAAWPNLLRYDQYLRGQQPLTFMSDAMRSEFGDQITSLVLNWCELGTEAYENRVDVEGFRFPGESAGDEALWSTWQANNMDEQSSMGHTDAIALSRAAVIVGSPEAGDDEPVMTVESAFDTAWIRSPKSGAITSGLKRWTEDDGTEFANLYVPGATHTLWWRKGRWVDAKTDQHGVERPLLVPLVNRPRTKFRDGRSEFESIIGLADAANKMATDMMISGEYHAMPRRWAFGLKRDDFVDANGNKKSAWAFTKGRLWANENANVKVGQFPEADLKNFHDTIRLLAQLASQILALPDDYMSFTSDNPPSADALRAAESRMVKRCERKHTYFGGTWEEAMRLSLRIKTGSFDAKARSLETVWRNPATPTVAQKADAVVKLHADGVIPLEQARIDMGYTPAQRLEMRRMDEDDLNRLGLGGGGGAGVGA